MSLILRRECQAILDSHKLSMLHTDIVDKNLAIVGECGQRIVLISGIRFNSNTITKEEITYAVELFEKFMKKYGVKLQLIIADKLLFSKVKEPKFEDFGIDVSDQNSHNPTTIMFLTSIKGKSFKFRINRDNDIEFNSSNRLTFNEILSVKDFIKEAEKKAKSFYTAKDKYTETADKLQKELASIATCSI